MYLGYVQKIGTCRSTLSRVRARREQTGKQTDTHTDETELITRPHSRAIIHSLAWMEHPVICNVSEFTALKQLLKYWQKHRWIGHIPWHLATSCHSRTSGRGGVKTCQSFIIGQHVLNKDHTQGDSEMQWWMGGWVCLLQWILIL